MLTSRANTMLRSRCSIAWRAVAWRLLSRVYPAHETRLRPRFFFVLATCHRRAPSHTRSRPRPCSAPAPRGKSPRGRHPAFLLAGLLYAGSGIGLSLWIAVRSGAATSTARVASLARADLPWLAARCFGRHRRTGAADAGSRRGSRRSVGIDRIAPAESRRRIHRADRVVRVPRELRPPHPRSAWR